MNNRLVYVIDPYCIWCYGNLSVAGNLYDVYKDRVDFKVLPAGLWRGEKIRKVTPELARMMTFLSQKVKETTDVAFGKSFYDMLKDQSRLLDSEIPSRAIITIGKYWSNRVMPFCSLLLQSFFMNGLDLSDGATYSRIARQLDILPEEFLRYFTDEKTKKLTADRFELAEEYAPEYPSLYLVDRIGSVYPVSCGYTRFSQIQRRINKLI